MAQKLFTIRIPEAFRDKFPGLTSQEIGGNLVSMRAGDEKTALESLGLSAGIVEAVVGTFDIRETVGQPKAGETFGQDLTEALTPRNPSGLNIPGSGGGGGPFPSWGDINIPSFSGGGIGGPVTGSSGVIGADDPQIFIDPFADVFQTGQNVFDPSTFFQNAPSYQKHQEEQIIEAKALLDVENKKSVEDAQKEVTDEAVKQGLSSNFMERQLNTWGSADDQSFKVPTEDIPWGTIGSDRVERGEAIRIGDLIANPQAFMKDLGPDAELVYTTEEGIKDLNPWVAEAMILAEKQAGFISQEQVALIQNNAAVSIAEINKATELELADKEGLSVKEIAEINREADKYIADLQDIRQQNEFSYLDRKSTLEFNLQNRAQQNEYNLLMRQGEQSKSAAAQAHAQTMKQFEIQKGQWETQQQQQQLHHTEAMQQFENQLASGELQATLEREARETEFNLRSADIDRQIEKDKIVAETNKDIATIQRLQAGDVAGIERQVALRLAERDEKLAELERATITTTGAQQLQAQLAGFEAQELQATESAAAQKSAAEAAAAAASPFGFLAQTGLTEAQLLERQNQLAAIQQQQFNPFDLSTQQFQELQALQARAGATPFGAITTAPTEGQTYTDLLNLQQAQAAQGPFQAAELGQGMGDISTILRGGLTPTEQISLARAPGNPFGLTATEQINLQATLARGGNTAAQQQTLAESLARGGLSVQDQLALAGMQARGGITDEQSFINLQNQLARGGLTATEQSALAGLQARGGVTDENEFMALQQSLARGGLTPTQRLSEVQAGAAPQNMANYLNFIGNPSAVGFAGQSGFLQNVADSPEGNIPASLFGLNVPQNTPAVPTNPTMADLTDLTDEQLGFYQGQQAAQNYQTPSQIFQQAQMVTPQGV